MLYIYFLFTGKAVVGKTLDIARGQYVHDYVPVAHKFFSITFAYFGDEWRNIHPYYTPNVSRYSTLWLCSVLL